ncbi:aminoacyl-histidine dipeptidase [Mycoplasma sp. P36-A1]|uniref:aminoacyl-histidine dipeptidase n=1 Tax=Mycoplasma sp. P36-A1 TaxID=3252900 RepID=UPI003C2D09F4
MDMSKFKGLESEKVFEFFKEINQIPRTSKNEKAISDHLKKWAEDRNLEVIQDEENNIIIKKAGQGKLATAQPVILQGHIDMVGEAGKNSKHDFMKDPIEMIIKGDDIYANDTTLGADDGIGVAYSMALLDDLKSDLPPLEVIITTDEETGMTGAHHIDVSSLKSKIFINIDCEEEGVFYMSCAGGNNTNINIPVVYEDVEGLCVEVEVTGGLGGHSGLEIHKDRANSNKVMGRFLNLLAEAKIAFQIIEANGGSKVNAITRDTLAKIVIANEDLEKITKICTKLNEELKEEYTPQDSDVHVVFLNTAKGSFKAMTREDSLRVVYALVLTPNGPQTYSKYIENLVQTSTNPGVLETKENIVTIGSACRSSVVSQKQALVEEFNVIGKVVGAEVVSGSFYPAWPFNPNSKIKDLFVKKYEGLFDKEPVVSAIHAGLECGLFKEKMAADVEFISFGPTINGAHTAQEHMNIASADNNYRLLKAVLQDIAEY